MLYCRERVASGYPGVMSDERQGDEVVEYVAGFIPVTAAGKARAGVQLAEAAAARTPERVAAMRAKLGLPPVHDRAA